MKKPSTDSPKRAAIYVRMSQNRDEDDTKPERQFALCRALAKAKGFKVVAEFDETASAYKGTKMPKREELRTALLEGEFDAVITLHMDRFLRSTQDMLDFIKIAREQGVTLHTCQSGDFDLSESAGQLTATIIAAVAQAESARKSERHILRNEQAAAAGKVLGGPVPFGWQAVKVTEDGKEVSQWVLKKDEADAISAGITAYVTGSTLYGIAAEWNKMGLQSRFKAEGGWTQNSVKKVLIRARNAGLVERGGQKGKPRVILKDAKGEYIKGEWKAICEVEEWQQAVDKAEAAKVGHKPPAHLLANLLTCSEGHPMWAGVRKSGAASKYHYSYEVYRCTGSVVTTDPEKPTKGCYISVHRDEVNAYVRALVRHRLIFGDIEAMAPKGRDLERSSAYRDQLRRLREEFAENTVDLKAGRLNRAEWRGMQDDLSDKIKVIEEKLGGIEKSNAFAAMMRTTVQKVSLASAAEVGEQFDSLPLAQRRLIVSTLFPTITVKRIGKGNRVPVEDRVTAYMPGGRPYVLSGPDSSEAQHALVEPEEFEEFKKAV